MNLDTELGQGATEAFEAAVTFSDDVPTVAYGLWEYNNPSSLVEVQNDNPWPGPGPWTTATVLWKNNATQKVYFQGTTCHWGNGLCEANASALDRMGRPALWDFLSGYVAEMYIDLPSVDNMLDPFLGIGFQIHSSTGNSTRLYSIIEPSCRLQQWIDWREGGKIPAAGPVWDV